MKKIHLPHGAREGAGAIVVLLEHLFTVSGKTTFSKQEVLKVLNLIGNDTDMIGADIYETWRDAFENADCADYPEIVDALAFPKAANEATNGRRGPQRHLGHKRRANSMRGKFVRFKTSPKADPGRLVVGITDDGMLIIQGWGGYFAPRLFVLVDRAKENRS